MAQQFELTPGERKALLVILFFCLIGTVITAVKTNRLNKVNQNPKEGMGKMIMVQVEGAVVNPGVYRLPLGARVQEAIQQAGGLRADADVSKLNIVAKLKDGQRIIVPIAKQVQQQPSGPSFPYPQQSYPYYIFPAKVDLNTATVDELSSLPGIGPSLAKRIIQYRQFQGRFNSVEELLNVPGIGEKKLERIRDYIEVR
ncbi:ComEA family DNA-binding protein [bacterium]|nr:ComEA family DNA-binding protein [bacterium]